MSDQSAPLTPALRQGVRADAGAGPIRYHGAYPTLEKAEEAVRLVHAGLGRRLTGDERVELTARTGASLATNRWGTGSDTGSVFSAVAACAGPAALLTRILQQLPSGYALLFGRAELTSAA